VIDRKKLEMMAEAIIKYSNYHNPDSAVYQARNPGGLRAFSPQHPRDEQGNRVFRSVLDGMQALLYDVELKITGRSKARLTPQNTLVDLATAYGQNPGAAQAWVKFLRRALADESITHKTQLSYFLIPKE
jgi:hypothetical protein